MGYKICRSMVNQSA